MSKWYKIPPTWNVTEREYRANIDGINIVFGAVLGFVLVGAEGLPVWDFCALPMLSASVVIMILYMGSSEYKLFYVVMTAIAVAFLPYVSEDLFSLTKVPKLQPTLAIWAVMVLAVECMPREKPDEKTENT